jgi:hypothetical protein
VAIKFESNSETVHTLRLNGQSFSYIPKECRLQHHESNKHFDKCAVEEIHIYQMAQQINESFYKMLFLISVNENKKYN